MASSDPLLVHVHVPKCAGISVGRLLRSSFGDRHLDLYSLDPESVHTPDELAAAVRNHAGLVSIASHAIRVYPPLVDGRRALYFCFLRDPLEQFLSYATYIKKDHANLSEPHRRVVPSRCDRMSVREIAEWLVTQEDENLPFRDNYTTRFLTATLFGRQVGAVAALAVEVLARFLFVGIVEEMETSLRLLRTRLAPHGLALSGGSPPVDNVSRDMRGDTAWLHERDRVGKLVIASLAADRELYWHARESFTRMAD